MALLRLEDFDPNYRNRFGADIQNFDVYTTPNERIGQVVDAWVDEVGNIQNLAVRLGSGTGQSVLLPFGHAQVDRQSRRFYLRDLSREQIDALMPAAPAPSVPPQPMPEPMRPRMASLEESGTLGVARPRPQATPATPPTPPVQPVHPAASVPPVQPTVPSPRPTTHPAAPGPDRALDYDAVVETETIPLREERLIVEPHKRKAAEVIVRKEIETEIVEVPIQREKLIVEQVGPDPKQLAEIDLNPDQ